MLVRRLVVATALALSGLAACALPDLAPPVGSLPSATSQPRGPHHDPERSLAWDRPGQASAWIDGRLVSSPGQQPVPIASVAKLMTAYLVVHRLDPAARVVVDAAAVADTQRRRSRGESVVDLAPGEVLERHDALVALLLPSANNVADLLAQRVAGTTESFVELMNETATGLGMTATTYADASGVSAKTVSTARDQLLLLRAVLRSDELTRVLGTRSARLPVAGVVRNTNTLLGHDGFVAGKTGSTSAAGGCLAFRVVRGGTVLDGVVLGQRGGPLIEAGLAGARALADLAVPG